MDASLAPITAQKRANNFGEAEALAVAYSANNEGQSALVGEAPDGCTVNELEPRAYTIECTVGEGQFLQKVSRSFRLSFIDAATEYNWSNTVPINIGAHQCPPGDEWGLGYRGFNETYGDALGACVPQVAWSENKYLNSDPDKWQYDLRQYADMKGYETHDAFLSDD